MNEASRIPARTFEHGEALSEFHYGQVALESGLHRAQLEQTHALLMNLDEDSLLRPFRARAGLAAPGLELGGWYSSDGAVPGHTFGQWISALSRYYAITGEEATRAKVHRLVDAFAATVEPMGKFYEKYQHVAYTADLLAGGLIDAHRFAHQPVALPALAASMQAASRYFLDRAMPMRFEPHSDPDRHLLDHNYVVPENQFIAWQESGNALHLKLARQYLFDDFFDPLSHGENVLGGLHAYTHANALCSAAKAYLVLGDQKYLRAARNGFDFIDAQSYVTGGWGPRESFLPNPGMPEHDIAGIGSLGESLKKTRHSFEVPCGGYTHVRLTRYLLRITRNSRYGDSMERVMYNTVLGAKPMQPDGRAFYYADYSPGARKVYYPGFTSRQLGWSVPPEWPCCSGSLPQMAADYFVSAYFSDKQGIYVNLYIPSTLRWQQQGAEVVLRQFGLYPLEDVTAFELTTAKPMRFDLHLRIPAWAKNPSIRVNGQGIAASMQPGAFATLSREWRTGDRIELELPRALELKSIDAEHPELAALVYGPLVLFALAGDMPQVPRQQLLAAKRRRAEQWSVETAGGTLQFVPWWAIQDEHYATHVSIA